MGVGSRYEFNSTLNLSGWIQIFERAGFLSLSIDASAVTKSVFFVPHGHPILGAEVPDRLVGVL